MDEKNVEDLEMSTRCDLKCYSFSRRKHILQMCKLDEAPDSQNRKYTCTADVKLTIMETKNCDFRVLSDAAVSNVKKTICIWPLLTTERDKPCQQYCPTIQPIKCVRFKSPMNDQRGRGSWTNLTYRPIIQGGLRYYGVGKLTPVNPLPGSPVLCRPAPVKPTDSPGMIVYCAPKIYCMSVPELYKHIRSNSYCS